MQKSTRKHKLNTWPIAFGTECVYVSSSMYDICFVCEKHIQNLSRKNWLCIWPIAFGAQCVYVSSSIYVLCVSIFSPICFVCEKHRQKVSCKYRLCMWPIAFGAQCVYVSSSVYVLCVKNIYRTRHVNTGDTHGLLRLECVFTCLVLYMFCV